MTGVKLDENLKNVDQVRSEVGMVFQSFNLFPHLTVLQNCALSPIWVRKMGKTEAEELAMEYLNRVHFPRNKRTNSPVNSQVASNNVSQLPGPRHEAKGYALR
ncbi:MAG: hypothetical protein Ct9H300mP14_10990 [Gammaproteobacteria bacterium]|nr:MAG: hypothetical protein Ct9H300mP14_10990 [Gammaproteobacteria bacterium]